MLNSDLTKQNNSALIENPPLRPQNVNIELVAGICSSKCTMCPIGELNRKKQFMDDAVFEVVAKKLRPYMRDIKQISFVGIGEPLLYKDIHLKVREIKNIGYDEGFQGSLAIITNATHLAREVSTSLIEVGLDTIIVSIDGIKKSTHESIRVGTNFDEVKQNVLNFVEIRDNLQGKTKLIIRFVRQQLNKDEWEEYKDFWSDKINPELGDFVTVYDVHNFGREYEAFENIKISSQAKKDLPKDNLICRDINDSLIVYADGTIGFCCVDYDGSFYENQSILTAEIDEIMNSNARINCRKKLLSSKRSELKHCVNCEIPISEKFRE